MGGGKMGRSESGPEIPDWLDAEVQNMMKNAVTRFTEHSNYGAEWGIPQSERNLLGKEDMFSRWNPEFDAGGRISNPWDPSGKPPTTIGEVRTPVAGEE